MNYIKFNIIETSIENNVKKITINNLHSNLSNNINDINVLIKLLGLFEENKCCFGVVGNNSLYWVNNINGQ